MGRIEDFLEMYESEATKNNYRYALGQYFGFIGMDPEDYFRARRNYEKDLKAFLASVKNRPPKVIRLLISSVRTFLSENGVELPERFWRSLRRKFRGSRALTQDRVPSNQELRRIMTHMDAKGRALYLTLASSGMRIGEALRLRLEDLDLDREYRINGEMRNVPTINIPGKVTKTGNPRIAFVSREAKEALEEWLSQRSQYIKVACKRSRYAKPIEDPRLFPFEKKTAYMIWSNAVAKAGLLKKDRATNRHTIHPHVLRKWYRTKLGSVLPVDIVESLMGHEAYLTQVYRKYGVEDLAKFYLEGEPSLLIFSEVEDLLNLRREVEEKTRTQGELIEKLASKIFDQEKDIAALTDKVKRLEDTLAETLKMLSLFIGPGARKLAKEKGLDRVFKKIEEELKG